MLPSLPIVNFHRALPKHLLIAGKKILVKNELTFHIIYNYILDSSPVPCGGGGGGDSTASSVSASVIGGGGIMQQGGATGLMNQGKS